MNQRYSFHDLYPVVNGSIKRYYLEPIINRKINTRNYKCYEENNVEQTKCLNHFYMSKLNCTFPWLKSTRQSLEKCGSKHLIKDLVNLIDNVSIGKYYNNFFWFGSFIIVFFTSDHYDHSNEVESCLIPNCHTTIWKFGRFGLSPTPSGNRQRARLNFVFDSNRKV